MEAELLDKGDGLTGGVGYSYVLTSTGVNSGTYEWKLEDFSHSLAPALETEDFLAGGHKWKLRLLPKATHLEMNYIHINLVSLNSAEVSVNLVVEAVNHRNPQNSRVSCATFTFEPNQEQGFPSFQDRCSVVDPNSGFFCQGRYVIKAFIEVLPTETNRGASFGPATAPPGGTRMIKLALLTDELFHQKLNRMHPFGLVYLPEGGDWAVSASTEMSSITAITAAACPNGGIDDTALRLWVCESGPDGSARVQRPLRSQTSSGGTTIGEICAESGLAATGQLTLYVETSKDGSMLYELGDDTWILFCKYMRPGEEKLTYLGSIALPKSCTVRDLESEARRLKPLPGGAEFEIVIQKDDLSPTRVWKSVTLSNSRLRNGDVFLLCQAPPNSTINIEGLRCRLQNLFCQTFESLTLSTEDYTRFEQHESAHTELESSSRFLNKPQSSLNVPNLLNWERLEDGQSVRQMESAAGGQLSDQRLLEDEDDICAIYPDLSRT